MLLLHSLFQPCSERLQEPGKCQCKKKDALNLICKCMCTHEHSSSLLLLKLCMYIHSNRYKITEISFCVYKSPENLLNLVGDVFFFYGCINMMCCLLNNAYSCMYIYMCLPLVNMHVCRASLWIDLDEISFFCW